MIKKIKGYIKRLLSPSPEENFKSKDNSFGEFEFDLVSSTIFEDYYNNLLIQMTHYGDRKYEDFDKSYTELKENFQLVGIKIKEYIFLDRWITYISGSAEQFASFINHSKFEFTLKDPVFTKLTNLLNNIDITTAYTYKLGVAKFNPTPAYLSTNVRGINRNFPIAIEEIKDKSILDHEVIRTNYMEILLPLLHVLVYTPYDESYVFLSIEDLVLALQCTDDYNFLYEYKESLESNFEIPGYKNLFDINLVITNDQDISSYDDIDEIIE